MLSDGFATRHGWSRAHLHRDRVNGVVRGRRGARHAAVLNGGAIPDLFSVQVVAEPDGRAVGTVDEDFAIESTAGDVFALGTTSWRIRSLRGGRMQVENADGTPPSIPFWIAEAPSRTAELSLEVARLRREVAESGRPVEFLRSVAELEEPQAEAIARYVKAGAAALGGVPSDRMIIAERFFDEAGGMQLVVHAPFGGRVNRAWGLALRKRFCRTFDFELQAAGTDDGLLLSLGEQHSFPLEDVFSFVTAKNAEESLTQALLRLPLFTTRFRWNATRALALDRVTSRGRVPPILQRARTEDLLSAVFPAQTMCRDNMGGGDVEVPAHPLVSSTLHDCLREALDIDGLREVLEKIKSGAIATRSVDTHEPSPFSHAIVNSAPYTFLDGAPLEERRARAVSLRRTLPPEDAAKFGALDAAAIAQVIEEARPPLRDADEVHDALLTMGLLRWAELPGEHLATLDRAGRSVEVGAGFVIAAERIPLGRAIFGLTRAPLAGDADLTREQAVLAVVRGHTEVCGPVRADELAARLEFGGSEVLEALHHLESTGEILRGRFRAEAGAEALEWCDRRLLQRIHRLTVGRLRAEIQPITAQEFMRFLFRWHHVDGHEPRRGRHGVVEAVRLLEGWEAPASTWEHGLIDRRVEKYEADDLSRACVGGDVAWGRLGLRDRPEVVRGPMRGASGAEAVRVRVQPTRSASLTFALRESLDGLLSAARPESISPDLEALSAPARDIVGALEKRGALFFRDLAAATKRLPSEIEEALWELLAHGLVTADDVENLRVLQSADRRRRQRDSDRGGPGRWTLLRAHDPAPSDATDQLALLFLRRYGIVWRDLAVREPLAPPWRELLHTYRRLEARGQVRGGRFVSGFTGEQFALAEAIEMARAVRRGPVERRSVTLAATDPLNLTGVVTPGARVPAIPGHWIRWEDGAVADVDAGSPRATPQAMPGQRRPKEPRHPFERPR